MIKLLLAFLTALILISCTSVNPNNLKVTSESSHFILNEYIEHTGKQRLSVTIEGLSRGTYLATFEDDEGTYFIGPKRCVTIKTDSGIKIHDADGGLWVPKEGSNKSFRIFAYIHPENNKLEESIYIYPTGVVPPVVVEALNVAEFGNINFGAEIKDSKFLDSINIENTLTRN